RNRYEALPLITFAVEPILCLGCAVRQREIYDRKRYARNFVKFRKTDDFKFVLRPFADSSHIERAELANPIHRKDRTVGGFTASADLSFFEDHKIRPGCVETGAFHRNDAVTNA